MKHWMKNAVIIGTILLWPCLEVHAAKIAQPFVFPTAKYDDFALSKTAASWDAKHSVNVQMLKEGNGHPIRVLETNRAEKWVHLEATSCQSVLKMPFGWFGLDEGSTTFFWTPDDQTQIISQFDVMGDENWENFKASALVKLQKQMPTATLRPFALPGESFAIEARGLKIKGKSGKSFVQVWQHNPQRPELVLSLSLSAPPKTYARILGLIGLMVRDREVQWGPR